MIGKGLIRNVAGSLVTVRTDFSVRPAETVRLGELELWGEIVGIRGPEVDIRALEDTTGLRVGEDALFTGSLLYLDAGPGFLGGMFDGFGRPLRKAESGGIYPERGKACPSSDRERLWRFIPAVHPGDVLEAGDVLGTVAEGNSFLHRILVPANVSGRVDWIAPDGEYMAESCACRLEGGIEIGFRQRREIRTPHPGKGRLPLNRFFSTGWRAPDTLCPLALGGTAVVAGAFGTGKTLFLRSLIRRCNADVIVRIGCGLRGNEVAEIWEEFSHASDGLVPSERMVLFAGMPDMLSGAREVAIYSGMTLAEYYRDMGYNVTVVIDSLAFAFETANGGYPANLMTRLARYCERAGHVCVGGRPERQGSITLVSSVSPAGGDFSDPVTQTLFRLSGTVWGLDRKPARHRHFPALDWSRSFSLYADLSEDLPADGAREECVSLRAYLKQTISDACALSESRRGECRDGFSEEEKWILYHAETLKVIYLRQDAFDSGDSFFSPASALALLRFLKTLDDRVRGILKTGVSYEDVAAVPVRAELMDLRGLSEETFSVASEKWLEAFAAELTVAEETPKGTAE